MWQERKREKKKRERNEEERLGGVPSLAGCHWTGACDVLQGPLIGLSSNSHSDRWLPHLPWQRTQRSETVSCLPLSPSSTAGAAGGSWGRRRRTPLLQPEAPPGLPGGQATWWSLCTHDLRTLGVPSGAPGTHTQDSQSSGN